MRLRVPGFFGLIPNSRWIENIRSGSTGVSGYSDSPPNWQWLARPAYIYPLKDMLLWSMGLGFGILAWFGWLWSGYRLVRNRKGALVNILPLAWIGVYFRVDGAHLGDDPALLFAYLWGFGGISRLGTVRTVSTCPARSTRFADHALVDGTICGDSGCGRLVSSIEWGDGYDRICYGVIASGIFAHRCDFADFSETLRVSAGWFYDIVYGRLGADVRQYLSESDDVGQSLPIYI